MDPFPRQQRLAALRQKLAALTTELVKTEEELIGKRVRIYYRLTAKGLKQTTTQVDELLSFLDTVQQLILNKKPLAHG